MLVLLTKEMEIIDNAIAILAQINSFLMDEEEDDRPIEDIAEFTRII